MVVRCVSVGLVWIWLDLVEGEQAAEDLREKKLGNNSATRKLLSLQMPTQDWQK